MQNGACFMIASTGTVNRCELDVNVRVNMMGLHRKQEVYSLLWKDVDLSKYLVAAAPYGGPIGRLI
jgi:hypothetical protein